MSAESKAPHDRIAGALLGGIVADAVALPYKDYSRVFLHSVARPLTRSFAKDRDGRFPEGQYSGDSQACLAVCQALIEKGEVDAETISEYLVPLWRDSEIIDSDRASREALSRLVSGSAEWHECGLEEGRAEGGPLPWCIPVALWHALNPESLSEQTASIVEICERDRRVRACAAGIAAAIAFAVREDEIHLGSFLDVVRSAAADHDDDVAAAVDDFPRILSQTDARAWRMIETAMPDDNYPRRDEGVGDYVVPNFLLSIYYFLKSPDNYAKTIERCVKLGGDLNLVMTLTGALSGAWNGASSIPVKLVDGLRDRDMILDIIREFRVALDEQRTTENSNESSEGDGEDNEDSPNVSDADSNETGGQEMDSAQSREVGETDSEDNDPSTLATP